MSYLALILLAIALASLSYYYIENFIPKLVAEVYQNFKEIYPSQVPSYSIKQQRQLSCIKSKSQPPIFIYQLLFILVILSFFFITQCFWLTFWLSLFFALTLTLAIIDYFYHFISLTLCQLIFVLTLLGDYWQILPFTIEQSVINGGLGFLCFYLFYWISRWFYGKEALGRGDYWLVSALSSCCYMEQLSLFIFIASVFGVIFYLAHSYFFNALKEIPYAPFLVISAYLLLFFNLLIT